MTLLRDMIGFVPQDTFLFHGTILDNIRFANPDASDEDILKAVKESGIDVFLDRLSMDLNTNVGVLGTKLSGGQKQLISIARIFIKKPKLLIFDEATAHLDFETENLLKEAINKLVTGKTTFIIAHRLSTVLNAHKILALDKGRIVGVGTHSQLYATNKFYKNIFDQQFVNMADAN